MRLLVSVRTAAEAQDALAGGADIIDAKEPLAGPLGAVAPGVLSAVAAVLPPGAPLSVALDEVESAAAAEAAIAALPLTLREGPTYAKLAIPADAIPAKGIVAAAVRAAARHQARPAVVAATFADRLPAGASGLAAFVEAAAAGGASGVLLDTERKDGRTLLDVVRPSVLASVVAAARRARVSIAVAGGLGLVHADAVRELRVDLLGVRGAVTVGDRAAALDREKVAALAEALRRRPESLRR